MDAPSSAPHAEGHAGITASANQWPRPSGMWLATLRRSLAARMLRRGSDNPPPNTNFALARPRRMKGSARAVLIWSLLIYGFSAVVLTCIMTRWHPNGFEQNYWRKWRKFQRFAAEERERPLAVMLGSSRAAALFKAGLMDGRLAPNGQHWRAYNFGVPATGPMREWMHLRDMIDQGIKPRLIIVEYLPPLLNEAHTGLYTEENWVMPEWTTVHQYFRFRPYLARPMRKASEWVEARMAPWAVYRLCLHSWLRLRMGWANQDNLVIDNYDRWGCRVHEAFTPQKRAVFIAAAHDYIPSLQHFRLAKGLCRVWHDMLSYCQREGIAVVLFVPPESNEFRSWYPASCLTKVEGLLTELHQTYGVQVIDARKWLNDNEFVDGHHANAKGSLKFTVRMLRELRAYLPDYSSMSKAAAQ